MRLKGEVIETKTDQFRHTEAARVAHMQHGAVTDALPFGGVGCIQDGLHFFQRQVLDHT